MAKMSYFRKPYLDYVELYREGDIAIFLEAPESTVRDSERFATLSGRPREVYLRRLARRLADSVGVEGPIYRGSSQ
jgi:hypothetical protein